MFHMMQNAMKEMTCEQKVVNHQKNQKSKTKTKNQYA